MATFGNTLTASTSYALSSANTAAMAKGTLTEKGKVTKITFRTRTESGTANIKGILYSDSSNAPGTKLGVTSATSVSTTLQGYDCTFATPVYLGAGTYWVGVVTDGQVRNYYEASDGTFADSAAGFSYASPPTSFGTSTVGAGAYETYATYTPSTVKTVDGVGNASIKTVKGVAIASVKTINGNE